MKSGWQRVRLGEVVTLQRGFDLPAQDRKPGLVPIVSSSGLSGTHSNARVRAPGVVTGRYGTIGEVFYLQTDFWPLNTTLFVSDFKGNDPRFISYLLRILDFRGCSDKSTVPGVNRNHLHQLLVPLPPLAEQKRIAHILGTLDDKIELNRRMCQTLEEMARALFKSWFVDFDPVRAKAAGRQPYGMDAATAALFPDSFQDSELGLIPEGWEVKKLGDVVEINRRTLTARDKLPYIDYIEISEVNCGNINSIGHYVRGTEPSRARRRLGHGDTVVSTVRPERRAYFLALNPPETLICSTGFAVITPRTVPWPFLHAAITQDAVFDTWGSLADGGAYPAIRPEIVGQTPLIVPESPKLMDMFSTLTEKAYQIAWNNRLESKMLSRARDELLPQLFALARDPRAEHP